MNNTPTLAAAICEMLWMRFPAAMRTVDKPMIAAAIQETITLTVDSVGILDGAESKKIPPTLQDVTAYFKKLGSDLNPETFMDHYEANGWFTGKNKMKNWHASARNAHRDWHRPSRGRSTMINYRPMTEWERTQKRERATELRNRLRELTHPGGCTYAVELTGDRKAQAAEYARQLAELQKELGQP